MQVTQSPQPFGVLALKNTRHDITGLLSNASLDKAEAWLCCAAIQNPMSHGIIVHR
jgi:hypothetical protein